MCACAAASWWGLAAQPLPADRRTCCSTAVCMAAVPFAGGSIAVKMMWVFHFLLFNGECWVAGRCWGHCSKALRGFHRRCAVAPCRQKGASGNHTVSDHGVGLLSWRDSHESNTSQRRFAPVRSRETLARKDLCTGIREVLCCAGPSWSLIAAVGFRHTKNDSSSSSSSVPATNSLLRA